MKTLTLTLSKGLYFFIRFRDPLKGSTWGQIVQVKTIDGLIKHIESQPFELLDIKQLWGENASSAGIIPKEIQLDAESVLKP
jgi:hypothetical protein